jgi:hypothetical protein
VLLYQAQGRLAEAEPLSARSLVILLKFTRMTGQMHPDLQLVFSNHIVIMKNTARNNDEVVERVWAVGRAADFDPDGYRKVLDQAFK